MISENTGCLKPCKYKKYNLMGDRQPMPPGLYSTDGFGIMGTANDTTVGSIGVEDLNSRLFIFVHLYSSLFFRLRRRSWFTRGNLLLLRSVELSDFSLDSLSSRFGTRWSLSKPHKKNIKTLFSFIAIWDSLLLKAFETLSMHVFTLCWQKITKHVFCWVQNICYFLLLCCLTSSSSRSWQ